MSVIIGEERPRNLTLWTFLSKPGKVPPDYVYASGMYKMFYCVTQRDATLDLQ